MVCFSVFGNPIKHSLSPYIHKIFSKEIGISYSYNKTFVTKENFKNKIDFFFKKGGFGANITSPFKEMAFSLCDEFTEQANISRSVNTIKKQHNGLLLGDNTDGIGLIEDLKRIKFFRYGKNILLIGAGGTAKAIIPSLLSYGCNIVLTNRTFYKAEKIARYHKFNNISAFPLNNLNKLDFNLIINATSASMFDDVPKIPSCIINNNVCCYDIFYSREYTKFISWSIKNGSLCFSDGLGMLVNQAALSVLLWHKVLPDTTKVLKILRENNKLLYW